MSESSKRTIFSTMSNFFGFTQLRQPKDLVQQEFAAAPTVAPLTLAAQLSSVDVAPFSPAGLPDTLGHTEVAVFQGSAPPHLGPSALQSRHVHAARLSLQSWPIKAATDVSRLRRMADLRAELEKLNAEPDDFSDVSSIGNESNLLHFEEEQLAMDVELARIAISDRRAAQLGAASIARVDHQQAQKMQEQLQAQEVQLKYQATQLEALTQKQSSPHRDLSASSIVHGEMEPLEAVLRTLLMEKRKRGIPHPELKSTGTLALCTFLSQLDPKGPCPLYDYIALEIHVSLLHLLRRSEATFVDAYGYAVGPQQPLMTDIFRLATSRKDIDADTFLESFKMPPGGKQDAVDGSAITVMTTKTKLFYERFLAISSEDVPLVTVKKQIVKNLEPPFFRNQIDKRIDWWSQTSVTLQAFIEDIDTRAEAQMLASTTIAKRGLSSALVATVPSASLASLAVVPTAAVPVQPSPRAHSRNEPQLNILI